MTSPVVNIARRTGLSSSLRPHRSFSTSTMAAQQLRIGFVPEHFSTPLHFAKKHYKLTAALLPFPSGTGHMVAALQAGEIDMAVGLTEGWVSGICKARAERNGKKTAAGFEIVGTYVESPLRWAISASPKRDDLKSEKDLQHKKVGVSRIGSGSYVMSYVLAHQLGWLDPNSTHPPFPVEVLDTFLRLRDAVNNETADFFMWEYFTSKRYYDNGEIKHIGDIYSPWQSWMIVASEALLYPNGRHHGQRVLSEALEDALLKINEGIKHFKENQEEAVQYISTKLDYSEEDAREWLKTVTFPTDVRGVERESIEKTMFILEQAGVIEKPSHNHNHGSKEKINGVAALLRGGDGTVQSASA